MTPILFFIKQVFESHATDIKAISDDAKLGYAGSIATGKVSNPKKLHVGMEPDIRGECGTSYEVDGFLITAFASKVRKLRGKRWASYNPKMRDFEKMIQIHLRKSRP